MTRLTLRSLRLRAGSALALAIAAGLAGCGQNAANSGSTVTVQGDVPLAYVKRANTISMNPTNGAPVAAGGDLLVREKSSPSAPEYNITAKFTQGKGDASDPEVSYDGKKIIFSMWCPSSNTAMIGDQTACTGHWNIWEYDMTTGGLSGGSFRRLTASTQDDDVDPAYLPGGRGFVFSSNRQTKSHLNQALGRSYYALDEYERERVFNLHTMTADGANITQISFNQSHDRNPVVRPNGDIMFSRWDHVGGRNHFKVFRVKPDGTDLFVLYGAHSSGNSFLHPRDMDPAGKHAGQLTSDLMPLSRSTEGGALVFVDAANYSEENTPANNTAAPIGGQVQPTTHPLATGTGYSRYGRITTPYPLWDGTDRVLLGFTPCQAHRGALVISCAEITEAEAALLSDPNRTAAEHLTDPVKLDVKAAYAIYMYDPAQQTWLNIATPADGFMYTDPIALVARAEPAIVEPTALDTDLAAQEMGLLDVRSVYDTDGLGRMGDAVLTASDQSGTCTTAIPKTAPSDPNDLRAQVADLARMKDPADPAYKCTPARFIRVIRAVAPPSGELGLRQAIGETDFEPQQIIGYAPIEPDGSFKLKVPADTPIGLAVVDAEGRAFQTHTNWIQVRPGERRTCDGCHSPRRGGALNSGAVVNTVPAALTPTMPHLSGETLALTRTRLHPEALDVMGDMVYTDVWADTTQPGITARDAVVLRYVGNTASGDDLATTAPTNGIVNYPDHIQPIWSRDRGADTCTTCHNASDAKLNLANTEAGTGRMASYEGLMVGPPLLDANGKPVTMIEDGVPVLQRLPALVDTMASEGDALGLARKSRLMEILSGQTLMSDATAIATHPNPPGSTRDHSTMLNRAEKRLIAEWMDLGGKYYNDPFLGDNVRGVAGLSVDNYIAQVAPILNTQCGPGCHQAIGSGAGSNFHENRLVLTGDPQGDFGVVLTMISDTCHPDTNFLLTRPSTVPHPAGAASQVVPPLPVGSANYNTIAAWILGGCH